MKTRKNISADVISLIKNDEKDAIYFFSKLNNPDWLTDLANEGFFDSLKIPAPVRKDNTVQFPNWSQSIYLEKISKKICDGEITDTNYIETYLQVLRGLYSARDHYHAINSVFKCVTLLPASFLSISDIESIFAMVPIARARDILLEMYVHEGFSYLLKSCEDNQHDREIFKTYVAQLFQSADQKDSISKDKKLVFFADYSLQEFEKKRFVLEEVFSQKSYILEDILCVIDSLLKKILEVDGVDNSSHYWRPAIEKHQQNQFHDSAQSIYVAVLFRIASYLCFENKLPLYVDKWKTSNKITLNRIYIALCTEHPDVLTNSDCIEKILTMDLEASSRHEIYHFLEKNFDRLDSNSQERLLDKIEAIESDYHNDESDKKVFTAWSQMRWLQSIKFSTNARAKKIYEDVLEITGGETDHPDFSSFMGASWIGPTSPWTLENFDKATINEIYEMLFSYKDTRSFGSPSVEGLSRTFEEYVAREPIKCSALIDKLLMLPRDYLTSFFDGYSKVWKEKKYVPVDKILNFCLGALEDKQFLNDILEKKNKAVWALASMFRFIEIGVKDDQVAFDKKVNSTCYQILKKCSEIIKPDNEYRNSSDAFARAINEPRGKLFEASILLALREARIADKNTGEFDLAWTNLYSIIEKPLHASSNEEISLYALIGAYYRQFLYLNESWFKQNLDLFAPKDHNKIDLWVGFMEGFCYVTAYVKDIYLSLYEKGHLKSFLRFNPDQSDKNSRLDRLQGRIVELAMVSYILGDQTLDSGLLAEIINDEDEDEWHKMVWSIITVIGEKPKKAHLEKTIALISRLAEKFNLSSEKLKWKKHFSGITRTLNVLGDPNEKIVCEIVAIASIFTEGSWGRNEIVDYLYRYRKSHPKIVGELFLKSIELSADVPIWPEDKIRDICESLKNNLEKEVLAKICRVYGEKSINCSPIRDFCHN